MKYLVVILFVMLLLLVGCQEPNVTGKVTAELEKNVLKNGESTTFTVGGENNGDLPANVELRITSEDASKLVIHYPGSLKGVLQPGESLTKIISVQGFTDYSSTSYWLKVQLINTDDGRVLDESTRKVTVQKN